MISAARIFSSVLMFLVLLNLSQSFNVKSYCKNRCMRGSGGILCKCNAFHFSGKRDSGSRKYSGQTSGRGPSQFPPDLDPSGLGSFKFGPSAIRSNRNDDGEEEELPPRVIDYKDNTVEYETIVPPDYQTTGAPGGSGFWRANKAVLSSGAAPSWLDSDGGNDGLGPTFLLETSGKAERLKEPTEVSDRPVSGHPPDNESEIARWRNVLARLQSVRANLHRKRSKKARQPSHYLPSLIFGDSVLGSEKGGFEDLSNPPRKAFTTPLPPADLDDDVGVTSADDRQLLTLRQVLSTLVARSRMVHSKRLARSASHPSTKVKVVT